MVAPSSGSKSLKEYLKRYENNVEDEKKKKKKKKKAKPDMNGVLVVDEDPIWQKPVNVEEEEDESADEERPQVDEDIEVKRMKRLELLKSRRPFGAISEDGSGWVSVSENPKNPSFDQNSDMSPPRKRRARNDMSSPERELKPSSRSLTDLSPPRQQRIVVPPENMSKPPSYSSQDSKYQHNSDISPPRKRRARYDTPSPEPGLRPSESGREVSDLSPPRQRPECHYTRSREPERKSSNSSHPNLDLSPPRRYHPQKSSEYEKRTSRLSDLPDISPPRRNHHRTTRESQDEDLSPPRKSRKDRSEPPDDPRLSNRTSTEVNMERPSSVSDLSPPRKIRKESSSLTERAKTGLVSGHDIKEEIARTKKEDWLRFKEMDPSVSGRGAEPVYRDKKTGQRMSKDELKLQKQEEKPKEIKLEWGKGLAQKREAEAKQEELELEKAKPFARTRDDPDLDNMLKERLRWGDPMAHLVKKKHSELVLPDIGDDDKMQESGFIVPQEIPSHSWLKRGLDAAPNRYNIRPGRHWDGVDRSNGFEKQMFKRTNEKQATEREAYLWSVADM